MLGRLVIPLGFLIGLASLFFVLQTLNDPATTLTKKLTGPDLLKQYSIKPISPIAATVSDQKDQKSELIKLFSKPTLLTFWSVGCGECEVGLPVLDTFSKSQSSMAMVLVNVKDDHLQAQAKLDSLKIGLVTYYDSDGSAFQNYEATMPSSYYVANSQIIFFFPGRVSEEILQALLTVR